MHRQRLIHISISFKLFAQTGRITGSNAGILHNPDAKSYGKNRACLDRRLPITLQILQRLIEVSPRLGGFNYQMSI